MWWVVSGQDEAAERSQQPAERTTRFECLELHVMHSWPVRDR